MLLEYVSSYHLLVLFRELNTLYRYLFSARRGSLPGEVPPERGGTALNHGSWVMNHWRELGQSSRACVRVAQA